MTGGSANPAGGSFGRLQWNCLIMFAISKLMVSIIMSLQSPFYPPEAESKGISATVYGAVMGVYRFAILILTPLLGIYGENLRIRRCFWLGRYLLGLSLILFGLLDFVSSRFYFVLLSALFRGLEGAGAVGNSVLYMMINVIYPDRVTTLAGLMEMMSKVGLAVGPILGAIIFELGGFSVMFISVGVFQIVLTFGTYVTLIKVPPMDIACLSSEEMLTVFRRVLRIRTMYVFIFGVLLAQMNTEFLYAIFEPNLRQFNMTPFQIGLVYLLIGSPQLLCVVLGIILDRIGQGEVFIVSGTLVGLIAISMMGPISFLPVQPSVAMTCVAAVLFGLAQGTLNLAYYHKLLHEARKFGLLEHTSGATAVSCFYLMAVALGGSIGPAFAGFLFDVLGFRRAIIAIFASYVVQGLMVAVKMGLPKSAQPRRHDPSLATEKSSLVSATT